MGSGPSGPGLVTVTVSGVTFSMRGGQYYGMVIETVALHEVLFGELRGKIPAASPELTWAGPLLD